MNFARVAASRQSAANPRHFQMAAFCRKPLQRMRATTLLFLAVASDLTVHAQTNDLPALVPAYGEIPPTFWEQHQAIVLIGVCAFLMLAALVVWKMFNPRPAPVLPPETIAREALAKLQMEPEDGKLLSEVSQILRRYVGAVFGFPGGEMTTAEFCAVISRHKKIGTELAGGIASFLRECDVRKFSPANSPAPLNAVARALEIISRAEERRVRSAPVPGAATSAIPNASAKPPILKSSDVAASGDGRTP